MASVSISRCSISGERVSTNCLKEGAEMRKIWIVLLVLTMAGTLSWGQAFADVNSLEWGVTKTADPTFAQLVVIDEQGN